MTATEVNTDLAFEVHWTTDKDFPGVEQVGFWLVARDVDGNRYAFISRIRSNSRQISKDDLAVLFNDLNFQRRMTEYDPKERWFKKNLLTATLFVNTAENQWTELCPSTLRLRHSRRIDDMGWCAAEDCYL